MILFFSRNTIIYWNISYIKEFQNRFSTERNHTQNFLVKTKNNLKSYEIKNNGKNIIEFYTNVLKLGNEPYEHVTSNNKDSEATTNTISIYPGQDCDIASPGILTGILVCTWL